MEHSELFPSWKTVLEAVSPERRVHTYRNTNHFTKQFHVSILIQLEISQRHVDCESVNWLIMSWWSSFSQLSHVYTRQHIQTKYIDATEEAEEAIASLPRLGKKLHEKKYRRHRGIPPTYLNSFFSHHSFVWSSTGSHAFCDLQERDHLARWGYRETCVFYLHSSYWIVRMTLSSQWSIQDAICESEMPIPYGWLFAFLHCDDWCFHQPVIWPHNGASLSVYDDDEEKVNGGLSGV